MEKRQKTYTSVAQPVNNHTAFNIGVKRHLPHEGAKDDLWKGSSCQRRRASTDYVCKQGLTVMTAPACMKGHRAPRQGPSESQPQTSDTAMKMPVVGRGTKTSLDVTQGSSIKRRTVVDVGNTVMLSWDRSRIRVEALQPISHGWLGTAVVPDHVQQSCI